ncbi:hypothetical protein CK203_097409 [Vitis vinifera]|uniref:Uncharacterized protein n=1 Tax=Vitis vinifera TaxID=29760 RepID=A0A438D9A5_VITVI|nr:hypothetical protein CK203_097409 [Vitis vinifera]
MERAFKVHELNGLEILTWEDAEIRESNEGEICVKNQAIEVSFIDICHDKGVCRAATIPFTPSMKAVRTEVSCGEDVAEIPVRTDGCWHQRFGIPSELRIKSTWPRQGQNCLEAQDVSGVRSQPCLLELMEEHSLMLHGVTGYAEPGRIMAVVGPSGSTLNLDLFGMGLHSYQIWLGRTLHQILINEDLAWSPLVGHP